MDKRPSVLLLCSAFFLFSTLESFAEPVTPSSPGWPRAAKRFPGPIAFKHRLLARQEQQVQVERPRVSKPQKPECPPSCDGLIAKAKRDGSVRVIIELNVTDLPDPIRSPAEDRFRLLETRKAKVLDAQERLLKRLEKHRVTGVKKFQYGPGLVMRVDNGALQQLIADPEVLSIGEDAPVPPLLNQSVPLIDANQAWTAGFTGLGYLVAVVDSGIDGGHPFLSEKLLGEACYSTIDNDPSLTWTASSLCPNGAESQTGVGAAAPCGLYGCDHGTHVAGIAAGKGVSFSGVAKDARILGIQAFTRIDGTLCAPSPSPCIRSFPGDQVQALEYVLLWALGDPNSIAAVNISIGGGRYTSNCDSNPTWSPLKNRIDSLREYRVATVIAAGNDGYLDALAAPACISSAISVGATTKSDTVPPYSNSASFLKLLAPGGDLSGGLGDIYSSVPGGGFAPSGGTSMAAPHVAGAFAVLRQQSPWATADDIFQTLRSIGVRIARNDEEFRRIRLRETPWVASFQNLYPTGMGLDADRNVYVVGEYRGAQERYTGFIKYSTNGQLLWSAVYDDGNPDTDTIPDVGASAVDSAGNVYVATTQSVHEGCGSGSPCVFSILRTLKYSSNGSLLWASDFTFGIEAHPTALTIDSHGHVYVASDHCLDPNWFFCTSRGSLVLKLNSNGSTLWTSYVDGSFPTALSVDSTGALVMGACHGYASFTPSVRKYDTNGSLLWAHELGGEGCISALALDPRNNVYATGDSNGSYLTVKYDSAGSQLWSRSYGVGMASSIDYHDEQAIFVTGGSGGTLPYTRSYGTVKYDANGNEVWSREWSTPVTEGYVIAEKVQADSIGNVFVSGTVEDTATDPSRARVVSLKYDTNGNQSWISDRAGVRSGLNMELDAANNLYMTTVRSSGVSPAEAVTIKHPAP